VVLELLAIVFGLVGVLSVYAYTWWLVAPPWIACFACIVLAGVI
jgi:hypothetical protein